MTELTRRRMLSAAVVAGASAIAGCSSSADQDDGPEGKELGDISIENVNDEGHTVDVIVEFDREIEHWSTHELEPNSGVTLERDWSTDPGEFRVTIRLDGDAFKQVTPDYFNDPPSCLTLSPIIKRDGTLKVQGGPCGSGDSGLETDDE